MSNGNTRPTPLRRISKPEGLKKPGIFAQKICARMKTSGQHEGYYIVIGWFGKDASNPNEDIVQISPENLFTCLHGGIRKLEGWSRWFSLKYLSGFGLYLCNGPKSTVSTCHTRLDTHPSLESESYYETVQVLSQFFAAYQSSRQRHTPSFWKSKIPVPFIAWWKQSKSYLEKKKFLSKHSKNKEDDNMVWSNWVKKLNDDGVEEDTEYKFSVELQYSWSPFRICFVLVPPLLLSFAIGIWYMLHTDDVVGAWTIALYVVATATVIVALLGFISKL